MAAQDSQPFHWRYPDLDDKNFHLHGRGLLLLLIVFAVLLFFTLLCFYIRWACRCPAQWSIGSTGPGTHPPGPSGQLRPLGLDPWVISSLPVLLHRRLAVDSAAPESERRDGEESMCSICLCMFKDGEKVKMLPKCEHTFHPECVDEWLRTRSSCPLCRACIGELQRVEKDDDDGGSVV